MNMLIKTTVDGKCHAKQLSTISTKRHTLKGSPLKECTNIGFPDSLSCKGTRSTRLI